MDVLRNQKIVAIVNPSAGRGLRMGAKPTWINRLPLNAELLHTEYPSHAEELAYEASRQGRSMVIAIGGDGTVHEVLNGLMKNIENHSSLGIISAGTANDYAKSLAIFRGKQTSDSALVDVGQVQWANQTHFFANVAGVGLTARVAHCAGSIRKLNPRVRYTLALLQCLGKAFGTEDIAVVIDDAGLSEGDERHLLMLCIAIGTREGSFELAPDAVFDDGLFDVLQVGKLTRWDLVRYFPGVLRGKIPTKDERILARTCRRVSLRCQAPIPLHLDGEPPRHFPKEGPMECTFDLLPKRIAVHLF